MKLVDRIAALERRLDERDRRDARKSVIEGYSDAILKMMLHAAERPPVLTSSALSSFIQRGIARQRRSKRKK